MQAAKGGVLCCVMEDRGMGKGAPGTEAAGKQEGTKWTLCTLIYRDWPSSLELEVEQPIRVAPI